MSIYDQIIAWRIETDLLNRVSLMQDLCNVAAWYLRDVDPQTNTSPVMLGDPPAESTVAQLKTLAGQQYDSLVAYYNALLAWVDNSDQQVVVSALALRGIDAAELRAAIVNMKNAITAVKNNIASISTKAGLAQAGDYLFQQVPSLQLVRRPWMLV